MCTQPSSNAIILISNLFFAQALKEIYGFAVRLTLLSHATAVQQNFCSYSQMAAECSIGPLSAPAALAAYQQTQELFQEERCCLLHNVSVGDRSPRSGSVTRFVLCRENTERLNVIARRIINIFLIESNGNVAMVWRRERKEHFRADSPQRMRLDFR